MEETINCYIWSTALYGAETWTFHKVDEKHLESFKMCWRRMEIRRTDHVRNEEVLHGQGGKEYPTYKKKKEE
jgi:hypothetical protein